MNNYRLAANLLSISRFFVPLVLFLPGDTSIETRLFWSMVLISTDFFDGYFARKAKDKNKVGKWLDHGSDKVAVFAFAIFFWQEQLIFPEIIFFAVLFESMILLLSFLYSRMTGELIVTKLGRAKMLFFCGGSFLIFLHQITLNEIIRELSSVSFISGVILSLVLVIFYFLQNMKFVILRK